MSDQKPFVIELWPIADLKPYPLNAKEHPKEQVETLARSIKRLGWSQPIVVDANGVIIAGHGRRLAALHLGLNKVPVLCRKDLSKEEAEALRLADNKVVSLDYDQDSLAASMALISDAELKEVSGYAAEEFDFAKEAAVLEMSHAAIAEDIGEAVAAQHDANEQITRAIDERAEALAKAFGFSKVTTAQARRLKVIMTSIEEQTEKTGAEALLAFFDDLGY